jgi:hypothetical protein
MRRRAGDAVTHRRGLLVVILVALCCGAFPATSAAAATVATVQAEQMQLPAGASIVSDRSASGGKAVQLTAVGSSLTSTLTLPSAATGVRVVARGTRCQQGWPAMRVTLDGTTLATTTVASRSWQSFSASASAAAGNHALTITDAASTACRALTVDDVVFTGALPPAPTVTLSATPSSISAGASSTVQWGTTNATACTASGSWSGSQPVTGSTSTGALLAGATYTLTCTGAGGSTSASTTVTVSPTGPKLCQSVAVPAYFYPSAGGLWSTADAATPGVGIMVANVANGPGTALNSDYAAAITQARAAGIKVYGYVYTNYGGLSLSTVEAAINAWKTLYGVTSIFLDEASTSSSELSYYQTLSNYVHAEGAGAQTIVNFGTIPAQSEMSAGDILVTFEGSYSTYGSTRFPAWMAGYAPSRFYNVVYQVPDQLSMLAVLREAASAGVGLVYATDDVLPNPYDTLPSYLSIEAAQAHSGC